MKTSDGHLVQFFGGIMDGAERHLACLRPELWIDAEGHGTIYLPPGSQETRRQWFAEGRHCYTLLYDDSPERPYYAITTEK